MSDKLVLKPEYDDALLDGAIEGAYITQRYQTMIRIVIPQAVKNIFPALCNEFIVLIKETAIVGYVGLMDIQKAGDFIKSATFEAFMPLIGTAVIYYVLIKLLTLFLKQIEKWMRKSEVR